MLLNQQTPIDRQGTLDQIVASGQLTGAEVVTKEGSLVAKSRANLPPADGAKLEDLFSRARAARGEIGDSLADGSEYDVIAVSLNENETLIIAPKTRTISMKLQAHRVNIRS